jgi:hypothetical protein
MVNQDPDTPRTTDEIMTEVRTDLAELRRQGVYPTGWLVDLADDNLIRLVPPATPRDGGWERSS